MLWRYSQNIVFDYNTNAIASIKNLRRQSWSVYDVIREYQIRGFSHPDKHLHWQNIKSFDYTQNHPKDFSMFLCHSIQRGQTANTAVAQNIYVVSVQL